ncbi:hypothetical protein [Paraburkholderia megapolitana]|uniref:hypothetical protein n=1 Tax=Paraburkholderia megapolitana TaxID=420953 RepID=UPI0039089657
MSVAEYFSSMEYGPAPRTINPYARGSRSTSRPSGISSMVRGVRRLPASVSKRMRLRAVNCLHTLRKAMPPT